MILQETKYKINIAIRCYYLGIPLIVRGEEWSGVSFPGSKSGEEVMYQGEEIVSFLASHLFEEGDPVRPGISRNVYRDALKLFKMFHINAPPVYRKKPLEEEGGVVRFGRGPGKNKNGGD
jgi:hypothetical protein